MFNSNVLNEARGADNRNLTLLSRCTVGFITLPIHILLTLTEYICMATINLLHCLL